MTSCRKANFGRLAAAVAAAGLLAVHAHAAPPPRSGGPSLEDRVNRSLGLVRSTVVAIETAHHAPGDPLRTAVVLDGRRLTLDLEPHSVRTAGYRVVEIGADGVGREVAPGPVRTLRGTIAEEPGSVVAASLLDDGLHAMIERADGRRHRLEPIARRVAGAHPDQHVIYDDEDVLESGLGCGVDGAAGSPLGFDAPGGAAAFAGPIGPTPDVAELACDADFDYRDQWGSGTESRVNAVINQVNVQYEQDVNITHAISTIVIRTSPTYVQTDPGLLLDEFRNRWLAFHFDVSRDLAQLFTGKDLDGNVIGVAKDVGVVCTNQAYCLVQSDYNFNFSCATDLSAHELGHLWGAVHCSCSNPPYTMNPTIVCANEFSAASQADIIAHRDTRDCLNIVQIPPAYCSASAGNAGFEHISRVTAGTIDQASGASGYSDFTAISTEMTRGETYPITVTLDDAFAFDIGGLWIDWNRDADFEDDGETITDAWSGTGPYGADIVVPLTASLGATRMRVRMQDGASDPSAVPCGITDYGEVEDYTIEILDHTPTCPADIDGPAGGPDGEVGFFDLLLVLSTWGPCPGCPADLDGPAGEPDDDVGFFDLLLILSTWGPCP